jgi:hypothetical protein
MMVAGSGNTRQISQDPILVGDIKDTLPRKRHDFAHFSRPINFFYSKLRHDGRGDYHWFRLVRPCGGGFACPRNTVAGEVCALALRDSGVHSAPWSQDVADVAIVAGVLRPLGRRGRAAPEILVTAQQSVCKLLGSDGDWQRRNVCSPRIYNHMHGARLSQREPAARAGRPRFGNLPLRWSMIPPITRDKLPLPRIIFFGRFGLALSHTSPTKGLPVTSSRLDLPSG